MLHQPRFWLVVPAAGIGRRMQAAVPKQYLGLHDTFLIDVTLERLLAAPLSISGCVVALAPEDPWWPRTRSAGDSRLTTCTGGAERSESVVAALQALEGQAHDNDWVLVHDVARPCITHIDIGRLVAALGDHPVGGILAARVSDTLKSASPDGMITGTVERSGLWRALTPQMFRFGLLHQALDDAARAGRAVTDEASALEQLGYQPGIVEGRSDNLKVTVPEDLHLAEFILSRPVRGRGSDNGEPQA